MQPLCISLGSACDGAMILDVTGSRHVSLPFDWLWNITGGINNISDIIKSDFVYVTSDDCYMQSLHNRWQNQLSVVYKEYPDIAHLHTNPLINIEAHKTLCERYKRFDKLLKQAKDNKNELIHFLYYINLDEIEELMSQSIDVIIKRHVEQINVFQNVIFEKYGLEQFKFLFIVQTNKYKKQAKVLLNTMKINYEFDINSIRNDSSRLSNLLWKLSFIYILIKHDYCKLFYTIYSLIRFK